MISRIAAVALAVAGGLGSTAATAVRAADVDPFALNTTAWLVSYQFMDDACAADPFTGTAQPMGRCLTARGEAYASYLYVCNSELGSGKLTYSGSNCEPETFIEYTETLSADNLDQCIGTYPVEVPDIVSYTENVVGGQLFQCTDESIGYGLLNEPATAYYNDKCKNALKIVGYYRTTECTPNDGDSFSVSCSKKDRLEVRYYLYDEACGGGSSYFHTDDVGKCSGTNVGSASEEWEYSACDGSQIPDGGKDAAFATAPAFGWTVLSAMALLALLATM